MATAIFGESGHRIVLSDGDQIVTVESSIGTVTSGVHAMGYGFQKFLDDLEILNKTLRGSASFRTLEHEFAVKFSSDITGHITAQVEIRDILADTRFETRVTKDQTYLQPFLADARKLRLTTTEWDRA